jgi:hypothetical protein
LTVVHIAVDPAVVVLVGPDGARKSADDRAGDGAFKDADARDQGAGAGTESTADGGTGGDPAEGRIIALRLAGLVVSVLRVAVDPAIIVGVGPDSTGKPANGGTDRGAFDNSNATGQRTNGGAAGSADGGTGADIRHAGVVNRGARTKAQRTRRQDGDHGLPHYQSPLSFMMAYAPGRVPPCGVGA